MRLRCALSIKIFLWKRSKGSANRLVRAKTDLIKNTKAKSVSNFSRGKFSSWNSSFSIHQQFSSLPKSSQDMNEQKVLPLYYLLSYHLGLAANPLPSKNSFVYPLALYLFVVSACLANYFSNDLCYSLFFAMSILSQSLYLCIVPNCVATSFWMVCDQTCSSVRPNRRHLTSRPHYFFYPRSTAHTIYAIYVHI